MLTDLHSRNTGRDLTKWTTVLVIWLQVPEIDRRRSAIQPDQDHRLWFALTRSSDVSECWQPAIRAPATRAHHYAIQGFSPGKSELQD